MESTPGSARGVPGPSVRRALLSISVGLLALFHLRRIPLDCVADRNPGGPPHSVRVSLGRLSVRVRHLMHSAGRVLRIDPTALAPTPGNSCQSPFLRCLFPAPNGREPGAP